eukprot:660550-Prymnesium_polylepis.1
MLDHPTIRDLAAFIASALPQVEHYEAHSAMTHCSHAVHVIGESCAWPCNVVTKDARWDMTASASDLVSEIPSSRFGSDYTSLFPEAIVGATFGATLCSAELFDHREFRLNVAEAKVMDPQQRLLLEHARSATHAIQLGSTVG